MVKCVVFELYIQMVRELRSKCEAKGRMQKNNETFLIANCQPQCTMPIFIVASQIWVLQFTKTIQKKKLEILGNVQPRHSTQNPK